MSEFKLPKKIFVVVDPSQDEPLALQRSINRALIEDYVGADEFPEQAVFLSVDMDNTDTSASNPNMRRDADWFRTKILAPLEASQLPYEVELSWSDDWYGAISEGITRHQPGVIIVPLSRKPSPAERIFNDSMWRLMRTITCPVVIAQAKGTARRKKILAAVHFQSDKEEYKVLNDSIIEAAQANAEAYGGELYIVNAYSDSLNYPDRAQLAHKTGVDNSRIFVKSGDADDVISAIAKEVDADLLVLGARRRTSRWRGHTAERIMSKVDCDMLVVNRGI